MSGDASVEPTASVRDLLALGYGCVNSDDKAPALGYFDRALEQLAALVDAPLESEVHKARGIALFFRREYDAALAAFETSLSRALACGAEHLEADASHNVGLVLHRVGRHADALPALERAVELFERQTEPSALPITWHTIARSQAALGRGAAALDAYDRAVDTAAHAHNDRELARAALGRALLQRRSRRRADAEASLLLALAAHARMGAKRPVRRLRLRLALWRLQRGSVGGALAALAAT